MRSPPAPPHEARALWAGPGAARALAAGASGAVEIALPPGGYVRLGRAGWLLLAPPRAPRGPLTVLVSGLEGSPLAFGAPTRVIGGRLTVGEVAIDPPPATAPAARPALQPGWRAALGGALAAVAFAPPELAPGLAALRAGDPRRAVAALAGRGPGLTPAGDDVLAGWAAWRHAVGEAPALGDAGRCSPLGLAYLRCAERGELPEPVDAVLRAIMAGDARLAAARAAGLRRWGATSGAAMLWGVGASA